MRYIDNVLSPAVSPNNLRLKVLSEKLLNLNQKLKKDAATKDTLSNEWTLLV